MRYLKILSVLFLVFNISSCCIKEKTCSILTFQNIELVNFSADEATGDLILTVYQANTNFTQLKNSINLKGEATGDAKVFKVNTAELSATDEYQLEIVKTGNKYRIGNFSVEKVACGKCFMRSNNQFGYSLNGYTVNGKGYNYDGKVLINK